MVGHVNTRILVISDTHGEDLQHQLQIPFDLVIHCGDLMEGSTLAEMHQAIQLLSSFDAPLKLIIAGNHDFTLDDGAFRAKTADLLCVSSTNQTLLDQTYGAIGHARALFMSESATRAGLVLLDEGLHDFDLANGAHLRLYASPYTASNNDWSFAYGPQQGHVWQTGDADVVITHGPPRGILDMTDDRVRAGDPTLFAAVARTRPQLHCFGHIHESWGGRLVTWKDRHSEEQPSYLTDIDGRASYVVETLARVIPTRKDSTELVAEKQRRRKWLEQSGFCKALTPRSSEQTLFLNAAIEGPEPGRQQVPWVVDLILPTS